MKKIRAVVLIVTFLLAGCGKQEQVVAPTATSIPATATLAPTETNIPDTATPTTETSIPVPTQDPTIFGAIGTGEVQAGAIEAVASAIFSKVMDGYIANGSIIEYQVASLTVFPSSNGGLLAEIIYNVRTTDTYWLLDGGAQTYDDWINNNCSRFDFISAETEFQLKNRRLCG